MLTTTTAILSYVDFRSRSQVRHIPHIIAQVKIRRELMINSVFHRCSPYLVGLSVLLLLTVSIPVFAEGEEVEWSTSIAEATTQSVETGKPIMMDFFTEW